MNTALTLFEVRVRVRGEPFEYYSRYGKRISHEIIKMFHFERRSSEQAIEEGRRYGQVVNCRKVNRDKVLGSAENIHLEPQPLYIPDNPYKNAVAMDEMVWKKRNIRRSFAYKDKLVD